MNITIKTVIAFLVSAVFGMIVGTLTIHTPTNEEVYALCMSTYKLTYKNNMDRGIYEGTREYFHRVNCEKYCVNGH